MLRRLLLWANAVAPRALRPVLPPNTSRCADVSLRLIPNKAKRVAAVMF